MENKPKENKPLEPNGPNKEPQKRKEYREGRETWLERVLKPALMPLYWLYLRLKLYRLFDLRIDTDVYGTIKTVQAGIQLKGSQVWILIASALLASIGLDQNSAAVIIGAMLISPLMSPILGIGLGAATNHREVFVQSLRLFGLYVLLAIVFSFLYFLITPLGEKTDEILARTRPTLLDVGVALFGGVAGIIATSRIDKSNAIPGVAIATALMPPLCVAAFGLASGELTLFFSAFFLFFLNSVFIAFSTYFVCQLLRFPQHRERNEAQTKQVTRIITAVIVLVLIPSGYLFWNLIAEVSHRRTVDAFIEQQLQANNRDISNVRIARTDSGYYEVRMEINGATVPRDSLPVLQKRLETEPYGLKNYRLHLFQTEMTEEERQRWSEAYNMQANLYEQSQTYTDRRVEDLEQRLDHWYETKLSFSGQVPFDDLSKELKQAFPQLEQVYFGSSYYTRFRTIGGDTLAIDTLPLFLVHWDGRTGGRQRNNLREQLQEYLKVRLKNDDVRVLNQ